MPLHRPVDRKCGWPRCCGLALDFSSSSYVAQRSYGWISRPHRRARAHLQVSSIATPARTPAPFLIKHHFDCAFGCHSLRNHGSDISHNHTHNNTFSHSCKHHCTHKDDDTVATTTTTSEITIPQLRQQHDLKHARAQKHHKKDNRKHATTIPNMRTYPSSLHASSNPHSSHNKQRPNTSTERVRGRPFHDEPVPTPRDVDVSLKCRFP